MPAANKLRGVRIVGLQNPDDIVANFGSPYLILLGAVLLPPLFMIPFSQVPHLAITLSLLADLLATGHTLFRPRNVFAGGFFGLPQIPIQQQPVASRKVLKFFCGSLARQRTILTGFCLGILLIVQANFINSLNFSFTEANLGLRCAVWLVCSFVLYRLLQGLLSGMLCWYAKRHWDEIQQNYEAWPIDQPYDDRLRAFALSSRRKG